MVSAEQSQSTAELTKQKHGLEDFAATAMSHGVEISIEIQQQIVELREELERRNREDIDSAK
jgi:hypothetical protein